MRKAKIFFQKELAGILEETEVGFRFVYDKSYLEDKNSIPISLTMPLKTEKYESKILFPFFDGLIPEGWLLDLVTHHWKIDRRDRLSLLLACCKDCVGAVSVIPLEKE